MILGRLSDGWWNLASIGATQYASLAEALVHGPKG